MTKKAILLGALLLPSLLGYATETPKPAAKSGFATQSDWVKERRAAAKLKYYPAANCVGGPGTLCGIAVKMGPKCDPQKKPDPVILGALSEHKITWHLDDSPDWDFDGDAIEFTNDPSAALQKDANGNRVRHWHVKKNPPTGNLYSYKIHLINKDGVTKCTIDPGIWV
jgi:hypothetical protein